MGNEICIIEINDEEYEDIYEDIISVEVEENIDLADVFNIRLAIRLQKDGIWAWIDDEHLKLWNKVSISVGFIDNVVEIHTGYITQVMPYFGGGSSQCYLDIKGMDGSVLMNTEEKLKDWPNKKDSDIASEIFNSYGFTPEVEDTEVVHEEAVSTIIQRETDVKFLKRLARRNGFECFVHNETGYFRPPKLDGAPQKVLAVQFGKESNVSYFNIAVDALGPSNVEMHQLDLLTKENQDVTVDSIKQKLLGSKEAPDLYSSDVTPAKVFVKHSKAISQPAIQTLCQGLYDKAEWFVNGDGEINSSYYEEVLRARELVTIKGVGEAYSGTYYVTKVKHSFSENGYTQHFNVVRNALKPEGSEDFGEEGLF
jgi:phage protein D